MRTFSILYDNEEGAWSVIAKDDLYWYFYSRNLDRPTAEHISMSLNAAERF